VFKSIVVAAVFLAFVPSAWAAGTGFAGTETVSNTGNVISCEFTILFQNRGAGRPINGRFTATHSSHGDSWKWQPGY
jgi:hypothetical protein